MPANVENIGADILPCLRAIFWLIFSNPDPSYLKPTARQSSVEGALYLLLEVARKGPC
jgi:hypothetical protein